MSLSNLLNQLSNEDGETANLGEILEGTQDHNADPEELTVVTDETVTELDEILEDMADKAEKSSDTTDALVKMSDAIVNLESKLELLATMRDKGVNLNAVAAKQYADQVVASLESRGFPTVFFESDINAMETSFESSEMYDYSVEAEEKTEGILNKIKAGIKKAIDAFIRMWRAIAGRFNEYTKGAVTLGKKLIALSEKVNDGEVKRKLNSKSHKLVIDGTSIIAEKLLSELETSGKEVAKAREVIAKNANAAELVKGPTQEVKFDYPNSFDSKCKVYLDDTGKVKIEIIEGGEGEAEPLKKASILSLGRKIIEVNSGQTVNDTQVKRTVEDLERGIKQLDTLNDLPSGVKGGDVIKGISKALKSLNGLNNSYNSRLTNVTNAAYRLGVASVNSY